MKNECCGITYVNGELCCKKCGKPLKKIDSAFTPYTLTPDDSVIRDHTTKLFPPIPEEILRPPKKGKTDEKNNKEKQKKTGTEEKSTAMFILALVTVVITVFGLFFMMYFTYKYNVKPTYNQYSGEAEAGFSAVEPDDDGGVSVVEPDDDGGFSAEKPDDKGGDEE